MTRYAAINDGYEGTMTIALMEEARIVRKLSGLLGNLYLQPFAPDSLQSKHLAPNS
jgi:hypothetical protein